MSRVLRVVWRWACRLVAALALAVAIAALALFGLARLGIVNPLVVISGSMEPGISRGDLLIDVKVPVAQLGVGQIVSTPPAPGHLPVSHRIVEIQHLGDSALLHLKGDANDSLDAPLYQITDTAWVPRWRIPLLGWVLVKLIKPQVMIPLAVAIAALIVFVLVPGRERKRPATAARHRADGREPARTTVSVERAA